MATVPERVVKLLGGLITAAGIVAFAGMFGKGIYGVWTKTSSPDSDAFVYVATALAAMVGGIVAVAFGQTPPKAPPPSSSAVPASLLVNALRVPSLNQLLAGPANLLPGPSKWKWGDLLGAAYAIIYVVFGFAAIATWVLEPANATPPLIKNLATTFLGMALPIIAAFFHQ